MLLFSPIKQIKRAIDRQDHAKRFLPNFLGSEKKSLGHYLHPKKIDTDSKEAGVQLNPNYTHFILVNNHKEGVYGGEIELRVKLERAISKQWEENDTSTVKDDTNKVNNATRKCKTLLLCPPGFYTGCLNE